MWVSQTSGLTPQYPIFKKIETSKPLHVLSVWPWELSPSSYYELQMDLQVTGSFLIYVVAGNFVFVVIVCLFIICKYTVAAFRHSRRGHQILLRMVVSHHVVAGI